MALGSDLTPSTFNRLLHEIGIIKRPASRVTVRSILHNVHTLYIKALTIYPIKPGQFVSLSSIKVCTHDQHHHRRQKGGSELVDWPIGRQLVVAHSLMLCGSWGIELRLSGLATGALTLSHFICLNFKFYLLNFETGFYASLVYRYELLDTPLPGCWDCRQILGIKYRAFYILGKTLPKEWASPPVSHGRPYKSLPGLCCCWQVGRLHWRILSGAGT